MCCCGALAQWVLVSVLTCCIALMQVASALEQELGAHALLIPFGQVTALPVR